MPTDSKKEMIKREIPPPPPPPPTRLVIDGVDKTSPPKAEHK